jgi:hypothetical protein
VCVCELIYHPISSPNVDTFTGKDIYEYRIISVSRINKIDSIKRMEKLRESED